MVDCSSQHGRVRVRVSVTVLRLSYRVRVSRVSDHVRG